MHTLCICSVLIDSAESPGLSTLMLQVALHAWIIFKHMYEQHINQTNMTKQSLQVRLCLVINKIDRLILELQLQPQEAYERIKGIITQVNMIVSAFESESFMSEADAVLAHENIKANTDAGWVQCTAHVHRLVHVHGLAP